MTALDEISQRVLNHPCKFSAGVRFAIHIFFSLDHETEYEYSLQFC